MRSLKRVAFRLGGRLPAPLKRALVRVHEAPFLVGVLGVVLDREGRVLLFRHTYRPFAPWGLPSGWLKPNESPGEAIVREIREETGLVVEFVEVLEVRSGSRPQRLDLWLRCRSLGGDARPSAEVEEARFFEFASLPELIGEQERFLGEHRARLAY
jgi:ADP-ribose pyrophosphatase YjhB (NUDIX family)